MRQNRPQITTPAATPDSVNGASRIQRAVEPGDLRGVLERLVRRRAARKAVQQVVAQRVRLLGGQAVQDEPALALAVVRTRADGDARQTRARGAARAR